MVFPRTFAALVRRSMLLALILSVAKAPTGGAAQNTASVPSDSASPFASARKLLQLGKFDQAITELEALRQHKSQPAGLSHELGVAYYKKGDYEIGRAHV